MPGRETHYPPRRSAPRLTGASGAGRHFTFSTTNRAGYQFAQVMFRLAIAYREAKTIHLIMDNLSTHTRKSLTDFYGESVGAESWNRFTIHYTPKHGSWLNQAEIEIGLFARQCLGGRFMPDLKTLRHQAPAWNRRTNRAKVKIDWRFSRRDARKLFGYKSTNIKRSKY